VAQDLRSEVLFVFPLLLCHREETIDKLVASAPCRVLCRVFVLDNVASLEFSGSIHWEQPPRDIAQRLKRSPDDRRPNLTPRIRRRAEDGEHFANQPPMMPFFIFNLVDVLALVRIGYGMPMTPISITGGPLPGISQLKYFDELKVKGFFHSPRLLLFRVSKLRGNPRNREFRRDFVNGSSRVFSPLL